MTKSKKINSSASARLSRGKIREDAIFPVAPSQTVLPHDYRNVLSEIKKRISQTRLRTALAANSQMVLLYWDIGRLILQRQQSEGWGAKIIDRLSQDLRISFPDMSGFSPRNLKYMRAFSAAWVDNRIVQRTVAQLPWRSNLALLDMLSDSKTRLWYAQKTIENGWSRDVLALQIESDLHKRQGKALNNFKKTLPPTDSDMAAQIFKDPYLFDFTGTADSRREREIEQSLVAHIQQFLVELGAGFAFVAGWETKIVKALPKKLDGILPTIEEIEAEFKDAPSVMKAKGARRG